MKEFVNISSAFIAAAFLLTACNQQTESTMAPASTPTGISQTPATTLETAISQVVFTDSGQKLGDGSTFSIALGDLDGDGDLDAITTYFKYASKVWWNNGGRQGGVLGTFSSGQDIGYASGHGIALGDLDGDNDLDVFLVHNKDVDQVWLNGGSGDFVDSGQRLGRAEDSSTSVSLADVDADGDLDAFTTHYQKPVRLWLNDGKGFYSDTEDKFGNDALSVALGDVELDGDLDALIAYVEQPNRIWLNDGLGNFTDGGQQIGSDQGWGSAVFGDIDADGDLDIVMASDTGGMIWNNTGSGSGIFTDTDQPMGESNSVTLGDIDGDNGLDAITCSELWVNDGSGIFSTKSLNNTMQGCSTVWLGDVDNDSDLDAFVGSFLSSNELWLNVTSD